MPLSPVHTHLRLKLIGASLAAVLMVAAIGMAIVLVRVQVDPGQTTPADQAFASVPASAADDRPTPLAGVAVTPAPATLAPISVPTATPPAAPPIVVPTATVGPINGFVALTFDAGADRGYAEDILDLLATAHAPSSFGVTGDWTRHNPDLVQRMAAEGHLVINHTLDHRSFTGLSDERGGLAMARRRAELEQADAIITPLIGHTTRPWYRLPYGDDDAQVADDVAPIGFTQKVGWSVDSGGWRGWTAENILNHCLQAAEPGAIYVLHVGEDSQDRLALGPLIAGLRQRGYGFATVADLP